MTKNMIASKKIVIVGLGKTGLSCVRYLGHSEKDITVMDDRQTPPGIEELNASYPDVKCVLGKFDRAILCSADEIILSPGVSLMNDDIQSAIASGVRVRGDIDIFSEKANAPIVAITGSNGKSTVTTLLGEMARQAGWDTGVGGNIGIPALDLLEESKQLYILELSSFQLETTENLGAHSVVILNISEDHMDRYPVKIDYLKAKQRIFRESKNIIINDDDAQSSPAVSSLKNRIHFGLGPQEKDKFSVMEREGGQRYLTKGFEPLLNIEELKIKGEHNLSNALAAMALASSVGISTQAVLSALRAFKGLEHRCQYVRTVRGVEFIDDSKATNPGSAATAISSIGIGCSGKVILIAGGESKGADLSPLKAVMKTYGKAAYLIGRDASLFESTFNGCITTSKKNSLKDAIISAFELSVSGDVVLMSPACASFDMFSNFEHRGRVFSDVVHGL